MANQVTVTVVQQNQYVLSSGPQVWSVPVNTFYAKPFTGTQPVAGVTVNSVLVVAPTGLNQPKTTLLVEETVAAIHTAANA